MLLRWTTLINLVLLRSWVFHQLCVPAFISLTASCPVFKSILQAYRPRLGRRVNRQLPWLLLTMSRFLSTLQVALSSTLQVALLLLCQSVKIDVTIILINFFEATRQLSDSCATLTSQSFPLVVWWGDFKIFAWQLCLFLLYLIEECLVARLIRAVCLKLRKESLDRTGVIHKPTRVLYTILVDKRSSTAWLDASQHLLLLLQPPPPHPLVSADHTFFHLLRLRFLLRCNLI